MSLIVDGVRSIRRKWFADKKLAHIKAIGVQSKTLIWDGFVFRVSWQDDIVSLRHIMAPMGVLVAASGASGVTLYSSEFWQGPFTTKRAVGAPGVVGDPPPSVFDDIPPGSVYFGGVFGAVEYKKYTRGESDDAGPLLPQTAYGYAYATPSLMPVGLSEDKALSLSVGLADRGHSSTLVGLFEASGTEAIVSGFRYSLANGISLPTYFVLPGRGRFRCVAAHYSFLEADSTANIFAYHWSIRSKGDVRGRYWRTDSFQNVLPPDVSSMASLARRFFHIGYYAFSMSADDGVAYLSVFSGYLVEAPYSEYFTYTNQYGVRVENPLTRKWKLLYTFLLEPNIDTTSMNEEDEFAAVMNGSVVFSVSSEQFLPLLDKMSGFRIMDCGGPVKYTLDGVEYNSSGRLYDIEDEEIEIDWALAVGMMKDLFGYPTNSQPFVPHDTVTFHSFRGVVCWTRRYGSVEIAPDGMFPLDVVMPDEVESEEGVRPVISYAGEGLYFCACDRVGDRILSVYLGCPFQVEEVDPWWERINLMPAEWERGADDDLETDDDGRVLYVRPVLVTLERVVLLAITRDMLGIDPETEEAAPRYMFAMVDTPVGGEGWNTTTYLKLVSRIPVTDEERLRFDVITYGRGEYTQLLLEYPSPPAAAPRHGLFDDYSDYPLVHEYGQWEFPTQP